jgi:hypothetical protein
MKLKIVAALVCAALPLLSVQGQAHLVRRTVPAVSSHAYGLVYMWLPDSQVSGRSDWQWLLTSSSTSPVHTKLSVHSLASSSLKAYLSRLPKGNSIELVWQFQKSELDRQRGLTVLEQLCYGRKIGFHILCLSGTIENPPVVKEK